MAAAVTDGSIPIDSDSCRRRQQYSPLLRRLAATGSHLCTVSSCASSARAKVHTAPPAPCSLHASAPPAEVRGCGGRDSAFSASEYRERGFTGPVTLFSPAEAGLVRKVFDDQTSATAASDGVVTKNGTRLHNNGARDTAPSTHPGTWADTLPMAQRASLLDLCSQVLGPNLVLWATVFWAKQPGNPNYIPWHQDAVYVMSTLLPTYAAAPLPASRILHGLSWQLRCHCAAFVTQILADTSADQHHSMDRADPDLRATRETSSHPGHADALVG